MNRVQECEVEILSEIDRICKKHNLGYMLSSGTLLGAVRHGGFIPWDDDIDIIMEWKDYKKFTRICKKELSDKFFLQNSYTDYWHKATTKIRMNNTTMIEKSYEKADMHHGVWVDIFPIIYVPTDTAKRDKLNRKILLSTDLVSDIFYDSWENVSPRLRFILSLPVRLRRFLCKLIRYSCFKPSKSGEPCDYFWGNPFRRVRFNADLFNEKIELDFEGHKFSAPKEYDKYLTIVYGDYMTPPPPESRNSGHHISVLDLDNPYTKYLRTGQPPLKPEDFSAQA